jgi:UDP-glucose 6-dehydrogenase
MIEDSGAKSVGFVGISFKPGTDDLRESPLVALAARLIEYSASPPANKMTSQSPLVILFAPILINS